jgi:hypothetical protein
MARVLRCPPDIEEGWRAHYSGPGGDPGATVVAVKRVNELGFYCLTCSQLAERLELTRPQVVAVVDHFGIRKDPDYYKEFRMGKGAVFKRYSQKAIQPSRTDLNNRRFRKYGHSGDYATLASAAPRGWRFR